jgi:peroxiredoxin
LKLHINYNTIKIAIVFFSTVILAVYLLITKIENISHSLASMNKGLKTISGEQINVKDKGLIVVILFSPLDCWKCLREIDVWNHLYSEFSKKLTIIGIVKSPDIIILKRFIENRGIKFPVVFDSTGSLRQKLIDNQNHPHKLFFKYGELIRSEPIGISKDSESEGDLISWIKSHI